MMDYVEIVAGVMNTYSLVVRCPRCMPIFEPNGEDCCAICAFHDCCGRCCAELHIGDAMRRRAIRSQGPIALGERE